MESIKNNPVGFEMIPEGEHAVSVRRVYPDNISEEEKEKAEKLVPKVILQCFTPAQIHELQLIAEKIIQEHLQRDKKLIKKKGFLKIIKSFFF
ncbi:MAG: hypothetical protein JNK14_01170 [Chitinophagaceae bacterium]|nr:hypothetical protein [Chitinophagaceae bacterium]